MKDTPKVGTRVKVTNHSHCFGHITGAIGTVTEVFSADSIAVTTPDGMKFYHCRQCIEEVK